MRVVRDFVRFGSIVTMSLIVGGASRSAAAQVRSSGPFAAVGVADKLERDMVIPTVGWRWRLGAGETLQRWADRIGADFSFAIEPSAAAIVGDKDSFEAQLVPFFRVEGAGMESGWSPYFEGGIGVIYTGLEGLRLGSNVLFSDNVGLGLSFGVPPLAAWDRVSLGYRFRHISHAGIFGQPNSGMNTHYLTFTLE